MTHSITLNPAQEEAAAHHYGPLLVVAGAGTGKTRTLVHRLVRMIQDGIPPQSILLLTFTRRASNEMLSRAAEMIGGNYLRVNGGTFHSFALQMLRRYGGAIGLERDFTIMDQSDTFDIISNLRSAYTGSKGSKKKLPRRETIAAVISKAKNKRVPLVEVLEAEYPQFAIFRDSLEQIAKAYSEYKKERQMVDFDDLLELVIVLMHEHPEVRRMICTTYSHIMVDEYQDTNPLQSEIVHLLADEQRNIMVVGDDAQSIYAFRGADHRNLFTFKESFEDVKTITLEQNYRSTQPILDVSNALLAQMSSAFRKRLFADRDEGFRPVVVVTRDEQEQARLVTRHIAKLHHNEGIPLSEIAVLFRASFMAFPVELELSNLNLDYVKYGGFKFTETAHIKDVMAWLRVLYNPYDDLSMSRVLMMFPGVGQVSARKINGLIEQHGLIAGLESHQGKGKAAHAVKRVLAILNDLMPLKATPGPLLEKTVELYTPTLEETYDDYPKRQRDLEQLTAMCSHFGTLQEMLASLALDPPTAAIQEQLAEPDDDEHITLSTMHSAKGLEWRAVFIIQACDGSIPMGVDAYTPDDSDRLDEELRLFYVGVTRAKEMLCISWPRYTSRPFGNNGGQSRFLTAMPHHMLSWKTARELMPHRI